MNQILPQPVPVVGAQGGELFQLGIWMVVPRQRGESDVPVPAGLRDPFDPVRPVTGAAQKTHHHQPSVGDDSIHIHINRQVMAKLKEVGEAQRGLIA